MGELQRSAFMSYLQVAVPRAAAEDFVHHLGKRSVMMITDLNSQVDPVQQTYMKDIIRLKETVKTIWSIEDILESEGIEVQGDYTEEDFTGNKRQVRAEQVEADIRKHYEDMDEQLGVLNAIRNDRLRREHHIATVQAQEEFAAKAKQLGAPDPSGEDDGPLVLKYITGCVEASKQHAFRRQVYLFSRGNSYTLFKDIADSEHSVYIVYYLGEILDTKLDKLCNLMGIEQIIRSDNPVEDSDALLVELKQQNKEADMVIKSTQRNLNVQMRTVNEKLRGWKSTIRMELAIRIMLNNFEARDDTMMCRGWVPTKDLDKINDCVNNACMGRGLGTGVVEEILPPKGAEKPTFFETNKFTYCFQSIIDTYGVPRYREYNPTCPSIITFPYLFAMMYGDCFHGNCVFWTAVWLIYNEGWLETSKRNELLDWLYCGRYLLLLMGFFSVYHGFIYNEVISLSFSLFGNTSWTEVVESHDGEGEWEVKGVYPFGYDPVWHGRQAQIEFTNSIKMKVSVIYGVAQMSFGLVLAMLNHIEYRDWVTLIFEWIPQSLFMLSFFIYMDFMIILKWATNWQEKDFSPPSLITALVNMVLAGGQVDRGETQLFDDLEQQQNLQFLGCCFFLGTIPVMLFMKPIVLWCIHGGKKGGFEQLDDDGTEKSRGHDLDDHKEAGQTAHLETTGGGGGGGHGHGDGEFDFGETFIHQMIHTIEYVLGTISNTASYLRLWALSLAHAQLSEVFYDKTLLEMMVAGPVSTFVGVVVFWGVTFGVLLVMDQLECFLHALRLHWVEFQNKFYNADGIAFEPFSYRDIAKPKET